MMACNDDSGSSDESWKIVSDGEEERQEQPPAVAPEAPAVTAASRKRKLNTANFSGSGNQGWQIGQSQGGNFAQTINIYGDGPRLSTFEHAAEYVQSLSSGYRQQKNANPGRTPSTCEWFLHDERFQEWRDSHEAHLLHVFAAPGCGKSVLARALIDESLLANEQTKAVAYYFFKSGQGEQDRAFAAIASILHQIYLKVPSLELKALAQPRYEAHGMNLSRMFDELWDILIETVARFNGNMVCILDALDECEESDRRSLISEIASFYSRAGKIPNLKFLVLSRPYRELDFYPGISRTRSNFIRFDGDDKSEIIAQEINMVIEDKIPILLADLSERDQNEITGYLREMENRTYLWLYLILEYVQKNIAFHGTGSDIKRLLNELPPEIDEAYGRMLSRSPYPDLTRTLLAIILAAKVPLTVAEAKWALKLAQQLPVRTRIKRSALKLETDAQFEKSLKDLCGLLLSVRDSKIYFIHETAREFLLLGQDEITTTSPWRHTFDLKEANGLLTEVCLAYLSSFSEYPKNRYEIERLSSYSEMHMVENYKSSYPMLSEKLKDLLSLILEEEQQDEHSALDTVFAATYGRPLLHRLCEAGLEDLVRLVLQLGAKPNGTDPSLNTALHIALGYERGELVPLLLEHELDLTLRNHKGHTVFTEGIGYKPVQRLHVLMTSWRAVKQGRPLAAEFFRGAVAATMLSRHSFILKLVLDNPSGFEASSADIIAAVQSLSATDYLECIQDLRENEQIISIMGGQGPFDRILATKVHLPDKDAA